MKKRAVAILFLILMISCKAGTEENKDVNKDMETTNEKIGKVIHLTTADFKQKVFNFDAGKEWKYEGDKPCIIDFYADWCGPCKMVAPILEDLANEYDGKLIVYKVNTDQETELAQVFGISSIPTLLFVPMSGQPQAAMGALPKESFKKAIEQVLQVQ
jgi:thioredoxin